MLVALIILGLYFWAYFADVKSISSALLINDAAAILAGISLVAAFVSYLWTPQKNPYAGSYVAFLLFALTTGVLIVGTGGASSPFIALWMVVAIFAGVFGLMGLGPLLLAVTGYLLVLFFTNSLGRESVLTITLAGELPLIISYLIWHAKGKNEEKEDRAYHELATELSQVSGKAEVVINAIADGVLALSGDGTIELINPAAQRIIGWGRQDALSLNYKSVLKLLDKQEQELQPSTDPVTRALANNQTVSSNDFVLLTNSGKKLLVSVVVSPIGQPGSGVIVVFRDITKEKQEERAQTEFVSTASHEMRTPIASIEGYLGLVLNPATAQIDEKARMYVTKAHESAEHLGRLFKDLLDISKADDGRLANNPKVVDVVDFVHDIVQGLQPKAKEKNLRMIFKPIPDDSEDDSRGSERQVNPVYYSNVDNDHLREVVSNLVENAIKYTPQGDVTVDVNGDSDKVTISVSDTGLGIPAEDIPHLFQKFYRVDNTSTREIGGTGLGLYLCRRLAEAMSGRIWVESQYKEGSTFFVEIPRTSHEDAMHLIEEASAKAQTEQAETTRTVTIPPEMQAAIDQARQAEQTPPPQPQPQPQPEPQPQPQYVAQPATQPIQQQPAYTPPPPQPTAPVYQPNRANTPLASIEQNPGQYLSNRDGTVTIPPRQ